MNPKQSGTSPEVVLYIRYSSNPQAHGDSVRRQTKAATEWCAKHNLEISRIVEARGQSAFHGDNLEELQYLASSLSAGSYIIVENLDRISRLPPAKALSILFGIVGGGLRLVTLGERSAVYTATSISELSHIFIAALEFDRAHSESVRKVELVGGAKASARAEGNRHAFAIPGWLRKIEGGALEPIPERVAVIREVFEYVAAGHGTKATSVYANKRGLPVPSGRPRNGWHYTYIQRLVRGRSVIGEVTLHTVQRRKRTPVATIPDWYPRIISDELYYAANESLDGRQFSKGRHSYDHLNPLRGILKCAECGSSYALHPGQYPSYFCRGRARGVCNYPAVSHRHMLTHLLPPLIEAFKQHFSDGSRLTLLQSQLSSDEQQLADVQSQIERLVTAVQLANDPTPLMARINLLSEQATGLQRSLQRLHSQLVGLSNSRDYDVATVLKAYLEVPDLSVRLDIESRIRQLVRQIQVVPGVALVCDVPSLGGAPLSFPLPLKDGYTAFAEVMRPSESLLQAAIDELAVG